MTLDYLLRESVEDSGLDDDLILSMLIKKLNTRQKWQAVEYLKNSTEEPTEYLTNLSHTTISKS